MHFFQICAVSIALSVLLCQYCSINTDLSVSALPVLSVNPARIKQINAGASYKTDDLSAKVVIFVFIIILNWRFLRKSIFYSFPFFWKTWFLGGLDFPFFNFLNFCNLQDFETYSVFFGVFFKQWSKVYWKQSDFWRFLGALS